MLAEKLVVNPNTVARAYRELEMAGVVTKRRTTGTYVSEAGSPLDRQERLQLLTPRTDALLAEARQLDVSTAATRWVCLITLVCRPQPAAGFCVVTTCRGWLSATRSPAS